LSLFSSILFLCSQVFFDPRLETTDQLSNPTPFSVKATFQTLRVSTSLDATRDLEEGPAAPDNLQTLVPKMSRDILETSLTLIYNYIYYQKDHIFENLDHLTTREESNLLRNKLTAIMNEIGEPISVPRAASNEF
jgi:hypothetical protein